jgi:hypothetical protein
MFCCIRPELCWIGLFSLNFGHLSKRMLFARCRKQKDAERTSNDALAKKRTHNALAQLSVSRGACKAKAQWWRATAHLRQGYGGRAGHAARVNHDHE